MIHKGPGAIDRDEVKRQLDDMLAKVRRGAIFPSQARIVLPHVSMTIKEARQFLGLPAAPILWGVEPEGK